MNFNEPLLFIVQLLQLSGELVAEQNEIDASLWGERGVIQLFKADQPGVIEVAQHVATGFRNSDVVEKFEVALIGSKPFQEWSKVRRFRTGKGSEIGREVAPRHGATGFRRLGLSRGNRCRQK